MDGHATPVTLKLTSVPYLLRREQAVVTLEVNCCIPSTDEGEQWSDTYIEILAERVEEFVKKARDEAKALSPAVWTA